MGHRTLVMVYEPRDEDSTVAAYVSRIKRWSSGQSCRGSLDLQDGGAHLPFLDEPWPRYLKNGFLGRCEPGMASLTQGHSDPTRAFPDRSEPHVGAYFYGKSANFRRFPQKSRKNRNKFRESSAGLVTGRENAPHAEKPPLVYSHGHVIHVRAAFL